MFQIAAPPRKTAKQENEMRRVHCRPGDLAIVIDAYNAINTGTIVKVNATHKNQKALTKSADDRLWTVTGTHPMTCAMDGKRLL